MFHCICFTTVSFVLEGIFFSFSYFTLKFICQSFPADMACCISSFGQSVRACGGGGGEEAEEREKSTTVFSIPAKCTCGLSCSLAMLVKHVIPFILHSRTHMNAVSSSFSSRFRYFLFPFFLPSSFPDVISAILSSKPPNAATCRERTY